MSMTAARALAEQAERDRQHIDNLKAQVARLTVANAELTVARDHLADRLAIAERAATRLRQRLEQRDAPALPVQRTGEEVPA